MNEFENERNNINIDLIEKRLGPEDDQEDPDEDSEVLEELVMNGARRPRQNWSTRIYRFMRKAVSGAVRGHRKCCIVITHLYSCKHLYHHVITHILLSSYPHSYPHVVTHILIISW